MVPNKVTIYCNAFWIKFLNLDNFLFWWDKFSLIEKKILKKKILNKKCLRSLLIYEAKSGVFSLLVVIGWLVGAQNGLKHVSVLKILRSDEIFNILYLRQPTIPTYTHTYGHHRSGETKNDLRNLNLNVNTHLNGKKTQWRDNSFME